MTEKTSIRWARFLNGLLILLSLTVACGLGERILRLFFANRLLIHEEERARCCIATIQSWAGFPGKRAILPREAKQFQHRIIAGDFGITSTIRVKRRACYSSEIGVRFLPLPAAQLISSSATS
ncbi:MAG: hypothetical protein A2X58_07320 [Nitrospirae bacterium GWC2_56_14]|nr:MAG: hypothetical protein A2X58_07320 [Nitrospirae bacterium GWC2_56_14]